MRLAGEQETNRDRWRLPVPPAPVNPDNARRPDEFRSLRDGRRAGGLHRRPAGHAGPNDAPRVGPRREPSAEQDEPTGARHPVADNRFDTATFAASRPAGAPRAS
ncbi:hypothetical protein PSD17_63190 [Pseudonocardia sp. D17]|nr:hypothetical protein PSD17_63190 [Pseudonocardia sp. D17]